MKEKWQSEKSRVKAIQGELEKRKRKFINATGGGPLEEIQAPNFDETNLNILKLIPPESYKGIESDSEDSDEEVDDATSSIGKLNEILNRSFSVKSFDQSFDFFFSEPTKASTSAEFRKQNWKRKTPICTCTKKPPIIAEEYYEKND